MKFHSLKTLMLSDFMDILIKGDYSLIVKEGKPTEEEISFEWGKLINDYYTLLGDGNYKRYLATSGRIDDKRAKIFAVISLVNYLKQWEKEGFVVRSAIKELANWGYPVSLNSREQYKKDLDLIPTKIKREERQLKTWIAEIQTDTEAKVTEEHFANALGAIANHTKVVLEPSRTSVWTYATMIKQLR